MSSLISRILPGSVDANPASSIIHSLPLPRSTNRYSSLLFRIMTICGNISRCNGCSQKNLRGPDGRSPLPPPDDLVIQHKSKCHFRILKLEIFNCLLIFRNVYYHACSACVKKKCPSFTGRQYLQINGQLD